MLVYEKGTGSNRHLYYATNNIPSSNDSRLSYKDIDGDSITPTLNDHYVDDGHGGIIRLSDNKFVAAFAGSTCIIPNASWTPETKTLKEIKITRKPTKLTYTAGDNLDLTGLKVQGIYESGDKESITEYTTSPANEATLTSSDTSVTVSYSGKTASFAITVTEA